MTLASLNNLPPIDTARGGEPGLLADELFWQIKQRINNHPRSLQRRIGPSELGTGCTRRLAHKLAGTTETNTRDSAWKPTVGTAVHAWLEDTFTQANAGTHPARWLVELTVDVGDIGGVPITGHVDLYDRVTATVIDWKIVGASSLRNKRANGPGEQYRTQTHLYGRGITRRGLPVDTVMIVCLPQNADLHDTYVWHEPYDEQVALDALTRASTVQHLVDNGGAGAAAALPTADAFCNWCPYYQPGATDLTLACPGHNRDNSPPATLADALTQNRKIA